LSNSFLISLSFDALSALWVILKLRLGITDHEWP
jgi:hypothetical protein